MARIACIVDENFEDSEFRVPYDRLKAAGHEVVIVGVEAGKRVSGKRGEEQIEIEKSVEDVEPTDFDALLIPGGWSPDRLRTNPAMVDLVYEMNGAAKPIAAVCHAPSLLIEAGIAQGRSMTSWPSIKTDLMNAGALWLDREVVEDKNLITSRKPADLPAFSDALLRHLERGSDRGTSARAAGGSR